jgi:hypothetical protein
MASVRCPGCGAKNSVGAVKCRLCGFDLRGHSELPMSQPKAGSAQLRSGSLKGVVLMAVLAVGAIVLAGVLLGILPGGDVLTDLRNKVPAIAAKSSDGWEEFTEPAANFKATMPTDRAQQQVPFQWSTSGTADQWVSTLGPDSNPDTTLTVQWSTIPVDSAQTTAARLTSLSLAWADSMGGKVSDSEETSFQGQPALLVQVEGMKNSTGDRVTVRALLIERGDTLYVLASRSIYADHPQFDRLVNGFAML